jgi:tetratricopeptide (TPR) repeat protein
MVISDVRPGPLERRTLRRGVGLLILVLPACCPGALAQATGAPAAADLAEVEKLFRTGQYDQCAALAAQQIGKDEETDRSSELKIKAELARGKYAAALETLETALRQVPSSLALRLLARDVYRSNGRDSAAEDELKTIEEMVLAAPHRFGAPEDRLLLGRFFLIRGADARKVLDQFYDVALKDHPDFVPAYLATAELALDKEDYTLAAETLRKAPKAAGEDPRFHCLLARAFALEDRPRSDKALAEALKINPHHPESLLLRVDLLIDSEGYDEAEKLLSQVFAVNPKEPRAWAYRAVLAHLRARPDDEAAARSKALSSWASNPEVDCLIGRKLAEKYRFAEGAAAERRALGLDPNYMPAKVQLCEALLRLGEEEEGWRLAAEIFAADAYNVVAYNLVTLHDRVSAFRTLRQDGFMVRMDPKEADLYGPRVLDLLGRARKTLCARYGVDLEETVIVEIFPRRNEFAVRTFGLPGAEGFLGVCFGRVITANSPASQGEHPSNWESVLWHEFCHVVTLTKTRNKMPRWLSEGISVYEEGRQDQAWAKPSSPQFRAMIMGDELTPLSKLSSAFLGAKTSMHLQFAYYESALAVEFLVEKFGLPVLLGLLDDLAAGKTIDQDLPVRAKMSLKEIDRDFALFARRQAASLAPQATWDDPELPADANSKSLSAWIEKHPQSFPALKRLGAKLLSEQDWTGARQTFEKLKMLYPEYVGPDNAYMGLAVVYRRLADAAAEERTLEELAVKDGDATAAYLRLMELNEAAQNWQALAKNARRLMAVNPLVPTTHRELARAALQLGQRDEAVKAYRALLLIDETDPAGIHYALARLLRDSGDLKEARREVLKTLDEAPRFLDAHRLLLELVEPAKTSTGIQMDTKAKPKARP